MKPAAPVVSNHRPCMLPVYRLLRWVRWEWRLRRVPVLGLLALGLPWLLFVRLAREVWEGEGLPGDQRILLLLRAHRGPVQDAAAAWLSWAGGPLGAPLLAGTLALGLLLTRRYRALRFFGLSVVGAGLLNVAAKLLLTRPRPALWAGLHLELSYSFPSGHAMAAAALAAAVGFLLWPTRWRWAAVTVGVAWALGMGWARIYLGVHYPSDVLAGGLGVAGWVSGLYLLFTHHLRPVGAGLAQAAAPIWRWYRQGRGK